jgi:RNA polymerase sigma-19 factor, ECF subfamily
VAAQIDNSDFAPPREDLSKLYEQYRDALLRFFRRRRRDNADDLMQTLYEIVASAKPSESVREPLKYLFGIAQYVLTADYKRSKREHARFVYVDPEDLKSVPDAAGAWSAPEVQPSPQQELLEEWLGELPRACQVAFLRSRRDGWTYREIASELHVTTHTVKKYLIKSMNHLRMHLRAQPAAPKRS